MGSENRPVSPPVDVGFTRLQPLLPFLFFDDDEDDDSDDENKKKKRYE
jgi:hypothetical protein